jgi:hypothetical protein
MSQSVQWLCYVLYGVRFLVWTRNFSVIHSVKTDCEPRTFYAFSTEGCSPRGKAVEDDQSSRSNAEIIFAPPYVFTE